MSFPKKFIDSIPFNEEEKFKLINSLLKEPIFAVRKNPYKDNDLFEKEDLIAWSENGRYLKELPSFVSDPLFHAGTYCFQEPSSMFLELVLKALDFSGKVFLDLCAAPGGKSTLINSCLPKDSLLVSNEVIKSRSWTLKENLDKWGSSNVVVTNNDPADFEKFLGFFDAVLVDAPCSREGMFRKDKNSVNEWSDRNVDLCSVRQKRILADIIPTINDGGVLIYTTCTFNEKENRDNLKWLQENYEVKNLEFDYPTNQGIIQINEHVLKGYQFLPGITKGEGFFLSAMRIYGGRGKYKVPKRIRKLRLAEWDGIGLSFLNNKNENYIINDTVHNFPGQFKEILKSVLYDLNPIKTGCEIGQEIKGKIKYSYELAFSNELNRAVFELVDVSKEEAIKYLQKRDLLEIPNIRSWGLIAYQNQPLGWVKKVGNRLNNYYPKEYRIRK